MSSRATEGSRRIFVPFCSEHDLSSAEFSASCGLGRDCRRQSFIIFATLYFSRDDRPSDPESSCSSCPSDSGSPQGPPLHSDVQQCNQGGHKASSTLYFIENEQKETAHFRVRYMLALPIFPGRPTYCRAVRDSPVDCHRRKKAPIFRSRLLCWRYLSSRAVARQVLSAQMSLTSVFGMGTGGPSSQSTPTRMDGVNPSFISMPRRAFCRFSEVW